MPKDSKKANTTIEATKEGLYSKLNIDALGLQDCDLYFRDKKHKSLGFNTGAVDATIDFFCKVFDLHSQKKQFERKFMESISGDGNELTKINALHSSALCALLCFFNISKDNPFEYYGVKYTDVYFEVKNKVFSNPSNIDVVLTGDDEENESSILFIECKFSEYIGAKSYQLSSKYRDGEYGEIFEDFNYSGCKVFQYGLKQLVAHYIGITNFINRDKGYDFSCYYGDERSDLYDKDFKKISFMEVIYQFENKPDYIKYKKEAESVFKALEKYQKRSQNKIELYGTTTYQELFKGENNRLLPRKVKEFYGLIEK